MNPPAASPVRNAADFFSRAWRGRGAVRSVFGATLRTFAVEYRGAWSDAEQGYVLEETAVYEGGPTLVRSWHISVDRSGAMVGLEASQGGRMFVEKRVGAFRVRYDRLRIVPGPNVASLSLTVQPQPNGTVKAEGWTRLFGFLPVFHTALSFEPM